MPAYNFNWWYSLYFITYIIINTYIFMSVFLAVVYNNYRKHLKVTGVAQGQGGRQRLGWAQWRGQAGAGTDCVHVSSTAFVGGPGGLFGILLLFAKQGVPLPVFRQDPKDKGYSHLCSAKSLAFYCS